MRKFAAIFAALGVLTACGDRKQEAESAAQAPTASASSPAQAQAQAPTREQSKWDGPLGLTMGLTVAQLNAAGLKLDPSKTPGAYFSETTPAPNGAFAAYMYHIGDHAGLCKVSAISEEIEANGAGDQIKRVFADLEEALTTKYGKPERLQFVKHDALFKEEKHWVMALKSGERFHMSYWSKDKGAQVSEPVGTITLEATSAAALTGRVRLVYEFTNIDQCVEETKKKSNASL